MNRNQFSKALLSRLILVTLVVSLVKICGAASPAGEEENAVGESGNGKQSSRHVRRARGDYDDSYGSHVDYFEPSPVDDSNDESHEPLPATADCPPICGSYGADESYPSFQSTFEDDSDASHGLEGDPESHDLEGDVKWTSE